MPATLLGNDQLLELVESIWSSMLGLTVLRDDGGSIVRDSAGLTACVQITGAWNGAVLFMPTQRLARRAAGLMLTMPDAAIRSADVHDGVAELCNIIGGGVKSLLPGPSYLSLPTVMSGAQYALHMPRTILAAQLQFTSEGLPGEVRILQGCTTTEADLRRTDPYLPE